MHILLLGFGVDMCPLDQGGWQYHSELCPYPFLLEYSWFTMLRYTLDLALWSITEKWDMYWYIWLWRWTSLTPFNPVKFCFIYFEYLFLCLSWWLDPLIFLKCLCFSLILLFVSEVYLSDNITTTVFMCLL